MDKRITSDPPSGSPLATYRERLPQVRRILRLYGDRVEIDAVWTLGGQYHQTVKLADLTAEAARFQARDRWFRRALTVGMLALAAAVIFTQPGYSIWVDRVARLGYGVAVVCAVMAGMTYAKRRYIRFRTKAGRPGLDVCRSGPDRRRFEEFAALIQRHIKRAGK